MTNQTATASQELPRTDGKSFMTTEELKIFLETLKTKHQQRSNNIYWCNMFSYTLGLLYGRISDAYGNTKRVTGIDREILEDKLLNNLNSFCRSQKERYGNDWTF